MDEISLVEQSNVPISSKEDVDRLAGQLADNYIDYLIIDTCDQRRRTDDSIEECLTHLEEVSSVLESYRLRSGDAVVFVEQLASQNESLRRLYDQVDALEQYTLEISRQMDQLEVALGEWDKHKKTAPSKIKQLIGMIPRFLQL